MKVFLVLLIVIAHIKANTTCKKHLLCMGCSPATDDFCISCFSWGSGSLGARSLIENACTTVLAYTAVENCKRYFGDNDGHNQTIYNCSTCKTNW